MAKQRGIIKLEGTIGDITFYKSQDGMLARAKGGVLDGETGKEYDRVVVGEFCKDNTVQQRNRYCGIAFFTFQNN